MIPCGLIPKSLNVWWCPITSLKWNDMINVCAMTPGYCNLKLKRQIRSVNHLLSRCQIMEKSASAHDEYLIYGSIWIQFDTYYWNLQTCFLFVNAIFNIFSSDQASFKDRYELLFVYFLLSVDIFFLFYMLHASVLFVPVWAKFLALVLDEWLVCCEFWRY